jgi:serine/threonine protein kinase
MEKLDHPLVSRFFEMIESKARIHLVMEFLGEGNLCTYIKEKKRLPEDEARSIFVQLIQGLEYMQAHDIVHRDIKVRDDDDDDYGWWSVVGGVWSVGWQRRGGGGLLMNKSGCDRQMFLG